MSYHFARINLAQTNYDTSVYWAYLEKMPHNIEQCLDIYQQYCVYKKFSSVMPMFESRFYDAMADILGYFDNNKLVAFSLIRRFDDKNALCDQFAWTYHNPALRLGIETLKTECAIYKKQGFQYLYLEQAHLYKKEIDGFEILGPIS
jgi:hypothetical protein